MARNIPKLNEIEQATDDSDCPNSFKNCSLDSSKFDSITRSIDDEESEYGSFTKCGTRGHQRSSTKKQFCLSDLLTGLGQTRDQLAENQSSSFGNLVAVFDLRNVPNKIVKGETVWISASVNVLPQRIASMYGASEDQLIQLNVEKGGVSYKTYTAIIDKSSKQNLTIFIMQDPEDPNNYRCINLPVDADVKFLLEFLKLPFQVWPFWKDQRLHDKPFFEQGIASGDVIHLYKIKADYVKCLYRAAPRFEQLYTVDCLSIDSIDELKLKIRETIRSLNKECSCVSDTVLESNLWLTRGKKLYQDHEFPGIFESNSDSSSDYSSDMNIPYDFLLHFQPSTFIPIIVSYRPGEARSTVEEMLIAPSNPSSRELCECISKILHCSPEAVRLIINGKKLPINEDLSSFAEYKANCSVVASVKRSITVNVEIGEITHSFSVMKLDTILTLKYKIANKIKQLPRYLKLIYKDKELVDSRRIDLEDVKDNCTVIAQIVEDRMQISIRKKSYPLTHLILEQADSAVIRDIKNFFRYSVKLSSKLDIELYKNGSRFVLDDDLTVNEANLQDKEILIAWAKPCKNNTCLTIFQAPITGPIKRGVLVNGKIYLSEDNTQEDRDENIDDYPYSLPQSCANIRLAQSFELEDFQFTPELPTAVKVQSLERMNRQPPVPRHSVSLYQFTHISPLVNTQLSAFPLSSDLAMMNDATDGISTLLNPDKDPPGVVSERELQNLARELPVNSWQFFVRDLGVPESVVESYIDAYPRDVKEAIFKCLYTWKQRKGREALTSTIQECLQKNGLRAISEDIFGYATV